MRFRTRTGPWLLLGVYGAIGGGAIGACAPGTPDTSTTGTFTTSSSGAGGAASSSSGGSGGDLFEGGPSCADPKDPDADFVANTLEEAPSLDTDKDGKPDYLDDDSDDDSWPDKEEAANPLLDPSKLGQKRDTTCDALADTDGDGTPDLRDLDADNDGVPDKDERTYDPDGSKHCRVLVDCDSDGVIDVVEVAGGSNPADAGSLPADASLYFVLPWGSGDQTKDFTFSTGVAKADIYFLVDTTLSMQPSIDNLKSSLDVKIIPSILNGDLQAIPPIPAITDANIGVGAFRDVPWSPYGQPGDDLFTSSFTINAQTVLGNVAPPVKTMNGYVAPASVSSIVGSLTAAGGGDGPEATLQALWLAAANLPYAATIGGIWSPTPQYPVACPDPAMLGVPCFRPQSLPIFVVISDAPMHGGPVPGNAYDPALVGGTKTYQETVDALKAINAKVVGVPVATGSPGAARADLVDLATKTGSLYHDPAFGGVDKPLVPQADVAVGDVSTEVVQLLGLLAGAGLHDVTTADSNYSCPGNVDCNGDGVVDPAYENPVVDPDPGPFDASKLITSIATVKSMAVPLPYGSLDATTFYAVRGDAQVTFRVHARNDSVKPPSLVVLRAVIHVQTPSGQLLGGKNGVRIVYFVVPQYIAVAK